GQNPVCRPAWAAVNAERESAGPASDSGSRPPANDTVQHTMGTACKGATFAHGQFRNPVEVELVSRIKVGDGAGQIRRKRIGQARSNQADVLVSIHRESYTRRRRRDVNGLR